MDSSKTLYYKDYSSDRWHVCFLHFYQNYGVRGYALPSSSPDVITFLTRNGIFLAKLDVPDQWYVPSVGPNATMLNRIVEEQAKFFESEVVQHHEDI